MAGVTPEGFETKRLPDILADLVESEQINIDPDINTDDDELLGQINNVFAQVTSEVWELAQAVNDNFNVLAAEGTNLDDLAALIGVSRQQATKSFTETQQYVGSDGTIVETAAILENPSTNDRFSPVNSFIIDKSACIAATYTLPIANILDSTLYVVTINGFDVEFTSSATTSGLEILANLSAAINGISGLSSTFELTARHLIVTSDDALTTFSIDIPQYFIDGVITVNALTAAQVTGNISVPSNAVTTIILGTPGLTSTTNPNAYVVGRDEETDEELRSRMLVSQSVRGTATVDAITDGLLNIDSVTSVVVYENDTFVVDGDGRPPKSFEAYVEGGLDQDIGDSIWSNKAAGIQAFGTTAVGVTDVNGVPRVVYFSRPVQVVLASASVEYDEVPAGFTALQFQGAVAEIMFDYITSRSVGEDLVPNKIYCPLYLEYPDTAFSNLLVNGSTATIVVDPNEVATIDINNITVSEA
jgi:uncharacterized phage protein gp47/JayE